MRTGHYEPPQHGLLPGEDGLISEVYVCAICGAPANIPAVNASGGDREDVLGERVFNWRTSRIILEIIFTCDKHEDELMTQLYNKWDHASNLAPDLPTFVYDDEARGR